MKASPAEQEQLLRLQSLDTRLAQLAHKLGSLPQAVRELLQAGVEGLQPQQFLLFGGAGLHVVLLVGDGVEVVIIARPGSPKGRCAAR